MRISTNMQYERHLSALMKTSERLNTANEQLISGEKFQLAGEDPFGMGQKMSLTTSIGLYQQYNNNGDLLQNTLGHAETVLSSINDTLMSTTTLLQKIQNGALSQDDKKDLADSIKMNQVQLYNLMNSQNPQGEHIFGGNQTQSQPWVQDGDGRYVYQGDPGQRNVQVAPAVTIQATFSGQNIFESVATRRTASADAASSNITTRISDQGAFDRYYQQTYDSRTTASNSLSFVTTAGSPDSYEIRDSGNNVLQSGDYVPGEAVQFNGIELTVDVAAGGAVQGFQLDPPTNDNILNSLQTIIDALKDTSLSPEELQDRVGDSLTHMSNTKDKVGTALWQAGERMNILDAIQQSNSGLGILNQEARASVSEVDLYESISRLTREENALDAAQTTFGRLQKLSLFDYIR